jgi:hypothetical protein
MMKIRTLLASLLAVFALLATSVPASAATAFPSDWECLIQCVQQYNSELDANVIRLENNGSPGKARTTKFDYPNWTNVELCITYKSLGNAWPRLDNGSGVAEEYGVKADWTTVCRDISYKGTNLNLWGYGSADKKLLVRKVTIN